MYTVCSFMHLWQLSPSACPGVDCMLRGGLREGWINRGVHW